MRGYSPKLDMTHKHPLEPFAFCPKCGGQRFAERNGKAKECPDCGFVYYFNSSAAVACFLRNGRGELLVGVRAAEPARGTLDLIGGFVDMHETAEQAAMREVKEETGLDAADMRYLFSLPNIYPYSGFEVHTLDMFFECVVGFFEGSAPADDVGELRTVAVADLDPAQFGLASIRKAVGLYRERFISERDK